MPAARTVANLGFKSGTSIIMMVVALLIAKFA